VSISAASGVLSSVRRSSSCPSGSWNSHCWILQGSDKSRCVVSQLQWCRQEGKLPGESREAGMKGSSSWFLRVMINSSA
jgi:hypothetical protein